jgi:urease accessory protein UreE
MICEEIIGNLYDGSAPATGAPVDWLDLQWHQCARRALRARTRGGAQLRILLPVGRSLRHGDVLRYNDGAAAAIVGVNQLQTTVLVVRPRDLHRGCSIALELGNLHVPVEVTDDEIVLLPGGPGEGVLKRYGETCGTELRRFAPARATIPQFAIASGQILVRSHPSPAGPKAFT